MEFCGEGCGKVWDGVSRDLYRAVVELCVIGCKEVCEEPREQSLPWGGGTCNTVRSHVKPWGKARGTRVLAETDVNFEKLWGMRGITGI